MASNNADKIPDLRLIDGEEGGGERRSPRRLGRRQRDGRARLRGDPRQRPAAAGQDRPRPRCVLPGGGTFADALVEEGFASSLGRRALPRRAVPPAARRPGDRGRRRRRGEAAPAGRARARLRDPVRERRQDDQGRDHESAGRARPRRAEVRDAPQRRVPRRRSQRRADGAAPPRARGRGDERDVPRHDRHRRRRARKARTTSRPTTGSRMPRSSASSTR